MLNKKILNNVLRSVFAGKEPVGPQEQSIPAAQPNQPGAAQPAQTVNKPVQRWRYYFYDAPPENSIKFSYLSEILKKDTPERVSLVEKLQGGNTGKYFADYFRWKKVVIATTEFSNDGKSLVVYSADLTPMGTKVAGSEQIFPEKSDVTVDVFEKGLLLYSDKRGNSGVINIDNSGESLFSDQDPPNNIVNVLLNRTRPAGRFVNYNEFVKIFDEYRIWATNLNQLLLPNFDIPTSDDVRGGHYVGGQAAFNQLVGPVLQEVEQKKQPPAMPSLKDKTEQKPSTGTSPFKPVDEQSKEPVKGDNLDVPTGSPMAKRYSSTDYRLKRLARRVVANYMEEDAAAKYINGEPESVDGIATGTTVKGIGTNPKSMVDNFKAKATQNRTLAKMYDEIAQKMTQFKDVGNI
jgi:hypothetical protein